MPTPRLGELPALEWELEKIFERMPKPRSSDHQEMLRAYMVDCLSFEVIARNSGIRHLAQVAETLNPFLGDEIKAKVIEVRRLRKLAKRNRRLTLLVPEARRLITSGMPRTQLQERFDLNRADAFWLYERAHPDWRWMSVDSNLVEAIKILMVEGRSSTAIRSQLKLPKDYFDRLLHQIDPSLIREWRAKIGVPEHWVPWTPLSIPPVE